MLMGSTNSFTPCDSNTMSPAPCPFSSIIRPYWKPEQPPPCTNTRRPLPALFSSDSSSLIFDAAVSETLIMTSLYQEPGWYTAQSPHALRDDFGPFPSKFDRFGPAALARHPRRPAGSGAGAGPAAASARDRPRPGRRARARPAPEAVTAAE